MSKRGIIRAGILRKARSLPSTMAFASLVVLMVISTLVVGCAANPGGETSAIESFPVQLEVPNAIMQALRTGKLIVSDGYLRVDGSVIIWPYAYSWQSQKDDIWVLNDKGERLVKVGDRVQIVGGDVPQSVAEDKIGRKFPAGVRGPFWLAGDVRHPD